MTPEPELRWFHALQFPDGESSPGRFSGDRPPNYTLFGVLALLEHLDISRATCIDIGTMDGLVAWSLAAAGAAYVTATDIVPRRSFELARDRYRLPVDYVVPFLASDLRRADAPAYDLIVYAGVLYHVIDPLPSLVTLRRSLRDGGYLLLETQYLIGEPRARVAFMPSERHLGLRSTNTFFRPSHRALTGMLEIAGFQPVASIAVRNRLAVLARATVPSRIATTSPTVRVMFNHYRDHANYREDLDYAAMECAEAPAAISYHGPIGDFALHAARFRTGNRFQPQWRPSPGGFARRMLLDLGGQLVASAARRRWLPGWPRARLGPRRVDGQGEGAAQAAF